MRRCNDAIVRQPAVRRRLGATVFLSVCTEPAETDSSFSSCLSFFNAYICYFGFHASFTMVLADTNLANLLRDQHQQQQQLQQEERYQRRYHYESNSQFPLERENRQCKSTKNGNLEEISVTNLTDGESLCYSLALIRGRASTACSYVIVRNQKNQSSEWPIVSGEFRAIVELSRGPNKLELEAASEKKRLLLIYEPRTTRLRVTPVYVICAGHDGCFQGPRREDRSPESAATRIGLGARLLQTLTAEKLREAGYGRKTFQLERDLDGAECLVMHSMLDVDRARAMNQRELWELIARELMTGPLASKDRKYLAFLSCTRYRGAPNPRTHEDTLARTQGHAALGGGGLALFGSACLHTWPTCMDQVLPRFLDATVIDTEQLMDDSNYRGTYGGCLATTLGSVLHELGHTFDLGHTREGIMGRGFDYVDRVFVGATGIDSNRNPVGLRGDPQHTTIALSRPLSVTVTVQEPLSMLASPRRNRLLSETSRPSSTQSSSRSQGRLSAPASPELNRSFSKSLLQSAFEQNSKSDSQTDRTFWSPSCAALLAYHRWFNSEMDNVYSKPFHDIDYDGKRNVVRSRFGIRVIELRETSGGMVVGSRQFPGSRPPLEALVPPTPPHCLVALTLVAEDSTGNILKHPLPTAF
ncbi:putative zinc metalloproteinase YIL108W [Ceratina calcarata]|uniref:Zinc metalloproteinase YIL108W n=1 Tax=Ceratina calcarata TaxID=156304 RepID=A0AAJ7SAQ5_9HYME|nr:putative zinc metalloproteinase YIL108W [Ceratina calcarata]XP_026674416.1 putative zinc metalloproteinase YIL108W [Ceratina calcarata]